MSRTILYRRIPASKCKSMIELEKSPFCIFKSKINSGRYHQWMAKPLTDGYCATGFRVSAHPTGGVRFQRGKVPFGGESRGRLLTQMSQLGITSTGAGRREPPRGEHCEGHHVQCPHSVQPVIVGKLSYRWRCYKTSSLISSEITLSGRTEKRTPFQTLRRYDN